MKSCFLVTLRPRRYTRATPLGCPGGLARSMGERPLDPDRPSHALVLSIPDPLTLRRAVIRRAIATSPTRMSTCANVHNMGWSKCCECWNLRPSAYCEYPNIRTPIIQKPKDKLMRPNLKNANTFKHDIVEADYCWRRGLSLMRNLLSEIYEMKK